MIDIVLIGKQKDTRINWIGNIYSSDKTINSINSAIESSLSTKNPFVLLWYADYQLPEYFKLTHLLSKHTDVLHSGLKFGMQGKPFLLNFISPVWMFNKDPESIDYTISSFRMHIHGSILRKEALKILGLFDTNLKTLEGAALDMGLRFLKGGAFIFYEPRILNSTIDKNVNIPLEDEVYMLLKHYSKQQVIWAILRSLSHGYPLKKGLSQIIKVIKKEPQKPPIWIRELPKNFSLPEKEYKISIIIPTLKRHDYIERVLSAMTHQTISPYEIIIIDEDTFPEFYSKFNHLPLKVLKGSNIGQSTARNRGIEVAQGDYIMMFDDDIDEIPDNFIEMHLKFLFYFNADVSCGTVRERDIDFSVHRFKKFIKLADYLPTENVLLKRNVLEKSDYFDTNFDKGVQEDHDLGMRIYLSGFFMAVNPFSEVYHHRAPRGGLREHKARKSTFSMSRTNIFKRNLLNKTSIYLYKKYFNDLQVREEILQNIRGTFVVKGNLLKKVFKVLIGSFLLPHTCAVLFFRIRNAKKLLKNSQTILSSESVSSQDQNH